MLQNFQNIQILDRDINSVKSGVNPPKVSFAHYLKIPSDYIFIFNPCQPALSIKTVKKAYDYFQKTKYLSYTSAVETRDKLIIGRFRNSINQKKDIIMSSNPQDEYNNKRVLIRGMSPFNLTQNECVISYRVNNKRLYYKISNLKKGEAIAYPSAPPKNR